MTCSHILYIFGNEFTCDKPHYENEYFAIPNSWTMTEMSDLFLLNPKNEVDDETEVGFVPMACVEDGLSGNHSFETRKWKDVKKGYCHFQNGDIGVAKISPCFENQKSCILHSLPNGVGTGTTELVILRSLGVCAPFYMYLFKSSWYISQGTKYFKGVVGQQRVNKAIFTELEVPLPSVAEQERIVAEIKRWFALIDIIEYEKSDLQETIKQTKSKILDLAIHGRLVPQDPTEEPAAELLKRINPKAEIACDNAQYGNLPNGWCECNLSSLCKIKGGKRIPRGQTFSKAKTPHIYIRVSDMKNNTIVATDLKYIDDDVYQTIKNYTISSSDLYLTIAGTIGNVGYVPKQFDGMNLTENAAKLTNIICDKKFLMYSLLSSKAQEHFKSRFHQVAQPKLSIETANSTIVCLPPLNEQHRIVAKIEELFALLDNIASAL